MFCPRKHAKTALKSTINFVCIWYVFIVLGIYNFGFWLVGRAGNCAVTNYFYDSVLRFFAAILSLLNCSFMPRNSHHVRQSWQTTKASFHNGSVIVLKGVVQQLRGPNFTQVWPPTLLEWTIVNLLHTNYTPCVHETKHVFSDNNLPTSSCPRSLWMPLYFITPANSFFHTHFMTRLIMNSSFFKRQLLVLII